jgi:hypothetical protein
MSVQTKGQVRPDKSAYHSIALPAKVPEKDISLLLPRACSTMDKIVDRYALTIYPYSLSFIFFQLLLSIYQRISNSIHLSR